MKNELFYLNMAHLPVTALEFSFCQLSFFILSVGYGPVFTGML